MKVAVQETKRLILEYLKRFPKAKDTPEGIAHWWIKRNQKEVNVALEELMRERIVYEKSLGKTKVYGLLKGGA